MRMKFLRILPETWVNTSWLFSSLTLNMALGSVSVTTAITSIASSFDKPHPTSAGPLFRYRPVIPSVLLGQNPRSGSGHRHRVLKMSAHASVGGHRRPSVGQYFHIRLAGIHHRFDGNHHSRPQLHAAAPHAKVGHLRIFVHVDPDSVAHKIPHHREASGLNHSLNRSAHIVQIT